VGDEKAYISVVVYLLVGNGIMPNDFMRASGDCDAYISVMLLVEFSIMPDDSMKAWAVCLSSFM
jgi:hypothetical protein